MKYEVRCENVDCRQQEIIQRKHDEENPSCTKCGSKTRTVIHAPGVIMKGEGWSSKEAKEERNLEKVL